MRACVHASVRHGTCVHLIFLAHLLANAGICTCMVVRNPHLPTLMLHSYGLCNHGTRTYIHAHVYTCTCIGTHSCMPVHMLVHSCIHFVLDMQGSYWCGMLCSGCARLVLAWNTSFWVFKACTCLEHFERFASFQKKRSLTFFPKENFPKQFLLQLQVQALHTQSEVFQASASLAHPERSVPSQYEPCASRTKCSKQVRALCVQNKPSS